MGLYRIFKAFGRKMLLAVQQNLAASSHDNALETKLQHVRDLKVALVHMQAATQHGDFIDTVLKALAILDEVNRVGSRTLREKHKQEISSFADLVVEKAQAAFTCANAAFTSWLTETLELEQWREVPAESEALEAEAGWGCGSGPGVLGGEQGGEQGGTCASIAGALGIQFHGLRPFMAGGARPNQPAHDGACGVDIQRERHVSAFG